MTNVEFESLLDSGVETQRLDFKSACNWDVETFAKDILALSNVRDGGYIIIGVNETGDGFEHTGVIPEQKRTFDVDIMKDQMSGFADPHVDFEVYYPIDRAGRQYVLIIVREFRDIPVICRRDSRSTDAGVIYYRNRNRRSESALVSNSYDMRDIIETATMKLMRRMHELGFTTENYDKKRFEDELGLVSNKEIIEKIKSKGYWRILYQPLTYEVRIKELNRCKEIVERNSVNLRGWDYPHFPCRRDENADLVPGDNYYEGWDNWMEFKELWRMYQSGQFVDYVALREDWYKENTIVEQPDRKISSEILNIIETIYFMTEIFEFLARLTKVSIYKDGVNISIQLINTQERILFSEYRIGRCLPHYKTGATQITFEKKYKYKEIIENPSQLAREAILYFFERFGWKPSASIIEDHQTKLLEKKY